MASSAIRVTFDQESRRLIASCEQGGLEEAIMRLRALNDIAETLSTEGLLKLAAAVDITRGAVRPAPQRRRKGATPNVQNVLPD